MARGAMARGTISKRAMAGETMAARFGPPPAAAAAVTAHRARSAATRPGVTSILAFAWLGLATMGFNTTRLAGFTVSDLFFSGCGAFVALKLLTGSDRGLAAPPMRKTPPAILAGSLVLITGGTLSAFTAWDGIGSVQVVARFVWLTLVWFWLLRAVCYDREALGTIVRGWRLGVLVTAAIGTVGAIGLITVGVENTEGRETAFFSQPNEYAAMLAVAVPLFVFDAPDRPGRPGERRRGVVRFALLAIVGYGIATSGSMTGAFSSIVGVAAGTAVYVLTRGGSSPRRRNPLGFFVAATIAVVGLFLLSTSNLPVVDRFTRFRAGDSYVENSIATRENRNARAIGMLDETLFIGTGLQLQSDAAARFGDRNEVVNPRAVQGIHNMYLKIAHEAGVPALVGLLVVMIATLNRAWRLAVNTRGTDLHRLSAALFGALAAAATQAMFHPIAYQRYFWVTIAMVGCLWAVRRAELRAALSSAEPGRVNGHEPHRQTIRRS